MKISVASRGRILPGKNGYTQMLEVGGNIANSLTHATKDSMILETYEEGIRSDAPED